MKHKLVLLVLFIFIPAGLLSILFQVWRVEASGTVYIRADGSIDPPTANIWSVDNFTYTFTSNIDDSIVVERNDIVVDGAGYALQGNESGKGFYLYGVSNVTIKNTEIKAFYCGVGLEYSSNNSISGNVVTSNHYGIDFSLSANNRLRNNILVDNDVNFRIWGKVLSDFVNDVDPSNMADGKKIYYLINQRDFLVPSDVGFVVLVNCTNVTVKNLKPKNNIPNILLAYTQNSTITKNNITNSRDSNLAISIWLINSSGNNIFDNYIEKGSIGIYLSNSSYNNIYNNTVTEIAFNGGISLSKSVYNNIYANTLTNGNGIWLFTSSNNLIIQNNLNLTSDWMCYMMPTGPPICEGIVRLFHSSNNVIYHNNFVINRNLLYMNDSVNIWDNGYPSGGNYWSNYTGTDMNVDGIGDTVYVIDEVNRDNYPLMHLYGSIRNLDTNYTYLTIQSAINDPPTVDGHTIHVTEGIYYENVVVNKSVSLIGANRGTTIIDGNMTGTVVEVITSNVRISNFTIRNSGNLTFPLYPDTGVQVHTSNYCSITNNLIRNNLYGIIILVNSSHSIVTGNNVSNNRYGIHIDRSPYTTLAGNVMNNNNASLSVVGTELSDYLCSIDVSNLIDGKPVYYLVNQTNLVVNSSGYPDVGYLGLINCTNIHVEGLTLGKNLQGLLLAFTNNSRIISNLMTDSSYGILLWSSWHNVLSGNTLAENSFGVWLHESLNNSVSGNQIMKNGQAVSLIESSNNSFFHNAFVNSTHPFQQSQIIASSNSVNVWDNGVVGNYWSDYNEKYPNATEIDGSGIWDTPYIIDDNNQDNYPMIPEFPSFLLPLLFITTTLLIAFISRNKWSAKP